MSYSTHGYIVNNITLPINASHKEAFTIAIKKLKSLGINPGDCQLSIYKRSVDARKKTDIKFVYSVLAGGDLPPVPQERLKSAGVSYFSYSAPRFIRGDEKLDKDVVVVGSGPCGLFAALLLAENGYKPILIERGGSVAERNEKIDSFKRTRILDPNTNIQFGAGGAGTFCNIWSIPAGVALYRDKGDIYDS